MILLADGRVLVVGNGGVAAILDPATDRWTATASLNKPRSDFAAIRLADGRVLVTGGLNGAEPPQSFSSTYLFDPRPGHETWDRTGLLTTARTSPAIAALPDGRVLVAGGYFRVEPDYGLVVPDDVALAAGAPGGTSTAVLAAFVPPLADVTMPPYGYALATAEIFDPATGSWTKTGSMRYARVGSVAVTLADGRILVAGASEENVALDWRAYGTAEIYDPATGQFTLAGSLPAIDLAALERIGTPVPHGDPEPLDEGTLVPLDNGGAVLIGLSGWWKHQGEITRSLRFDAASGTWHEIGTPWVSAWSNEEPYDSWETAGPRHIYATVVKLGDGRVLVAGGYSGITQYESGVTAAAQLYDPVTDTWTKLPKMPSGRIGGTGVLLGDGSVLIAGGQDASRNDVRPVVRFTPGP